MSNNNKKKITFIVPVCSRGRIWKSIHETPLIDKCFSSIVNTVSESDLSKYDIEIKIGFDNDDPYFVNDYMANIEKIKQYIQAHSSFDFSYHAFPDTKHNPVQCWNHLARIAVNNGSDYLYQTGDDVELQTKGWADAFISALESTGNVGVAAPRDLGYYGLYTQSFVHRTHLDIMGEYYDSVFKSWYCDDFITGVYKPIYNHYLEDYHIKNTGGPQRYNADDAQPKLVEAVARGQIKLAKWLKSNDSDFDLDGLRKQIVSVHERYEQISKQMTTAPAKPIWASATKIFNGLWEAEFNDRRTTQAKAAATR